jgi:2-polyprenyl-6-methoxyphenol hydroxylase-like FAD-dependent oxidoreductase
MRKIPGMEAAVRAKKVEMEGISWVREDDRPYGIIRPTGNPDQQSLISEYEIYRGDLAQILVDMTKDNKNVKYIFGEQVTSIRQNEKEDGPATVEFANGLPPAEFDLVVACDGSTSRTRAIGLGCVVRDHIKPTNCWAAFFNIDRDFFKGSKIGRGYSAPGGRCIFLGSDPAGGSQVGLMSMHPPDKRDLTLPFREAMKQGDEALRKFVAEHYKDAGWKSEAIFENIMEARGFYANEVVQVSVPSLSKGRFVLCGDAGYGPSFTGGGTTLALTGAYILAGEVLKHKGDLAAGLNSYEEVMGPIIKDMQKVPPFITTIMAPQTAWGIWLRNHIFAFVAWSGIVEFGQKYFANAFASTDKYKLPEYDWVA